MGKVHGGLALSGSAAGSGGVDLASLGKSNGNILVVALSEVVARLDSVHATGSDDDHGGVGGALATIDKGAGVVTVRLYLPHGMSLVVLEAVDNTVADWGRFGCAVVDFCSSTNGSLGREARVEAQAAVDVLVDGLIFVA